MRIHNHNINTKKSFNHKIRNLKRAIRDRLFLNDMKEISEDFRTVDFRK